MMDKTKTENKMKQSLKVHYRGISEYQELDVTFTKKNVGQKRS
jgi:hypothetical protein